MTSQEAEEEVDDIDRLFDFLQQKARFSAVDAVIR